MLSPSPPLCSRQPCHKGSASFSLETQRLYSLGKGAEHHRAKVCSEPSGASDPPVIDICGEQEAGTRFTASLFPTPSPCWRESSSQKLITPVPFPSIRKVFFPLRHPLTSSLGGLCIGSLCNALSSRAVLQLWPGVTPAAHPVAQDAGAEMGHCCSEQVQGMGVCCLPSPRCASP